MRSEVIMSYLERTMMLNFSLYGEPIDYLEWVRNF